MGTNIQKVELLAPAGDLEKLKMAITYGADAVYLAGKQFGLRAGAGNFTDEQMQAGIAFAHERGKKVYVTVNIFAHNDDLSGLPAYLHTLEQLGVDAVIVADPGVFAIVRREVPNLHVHISTQANTTNWSAVQFWQQQGASRVVLARELSFEEIRAVKDQVDVELEAFVHGAMCISYSGRCLLSNYMTGRDANKGECAQACRWQYNLVEEKRPGQFFPIEEDERGTYVFNSQDLCMIEYIPQLIEAGIYSFKIEGRMKSIHYVATIVNAYRQAIDAYFANPEKYQLQEAWLAEIDKVSNRSYTTGFYLGKPDNQGRVYTTSGYRRTYDFIGVVKGYLAETKEAVVEQRNHFRVGDEIEVYSPAGQSFIQTISALRDKKGQAIEVAPHAQQEVFLVVEQPVELGSLVRRVKTQQ